MSNPNAKPPLLELWQLSKRYPGVVANDQVSFSLQQGEILALLGENGAGKSTLVKMIYGVEQPDSGSLLWLGKERVFASPTEARAAGIGMVFQHFSLFETLTVAENIALALAPETVRRMSNLPERIRELSQRYQLQVEPERYVHSLSIGERQRVEILRCLIQDVKLLILDEPTSVLAPQEVASLFTVLRQLAADDCSTLFISHKLSEVTELCDRAVILRGGKLTGSCNPQQETPVSIARMMVGDDTLLSESYPKQLTNASRLTVNNLSSTPDHPFGTPLSAINFELNAGEILGIAGVAGNGQQELLEVLSGEQPHPHPASIKLEEQPIADLHAGQRRKLGMAYVPPDRLGQGAVPDMSLAENLLLTHTHDELHTRGVISHGSVSTLTRQLIDSQQVKCSGPDAEARSLSGGNLQKFIIAREVSQQPRVLICAHPTWGVDIGAASTIHRQLIALRDQGAAVLVISEDLDELYLLCDRLAALYDGQLSPVVPTEQIPLTQLGQWMSGVFVKERQHG